MKQYIITEADLLHTTDCVEECDMDELAKMLRSLPELPSCPDCAAKETKIDWLMGEYHEAVRIIKQGKAQFAPDTTNSDADMFLRRAARREMSDGNTELL